MLENIYWNNTLKSWGISLIILIVTYLLTKLVRTINQKVIKKITAKTVTKTDDAIFEAIEAPIKFGIALLGIWIALHRLNLSPSLSRGVEAAYQILIVLNATWLIIRVLNTLLDSYWADKADDSAKTKKHTARMMPIVKRMIVIIVWLIGIVTALSNVGVNITALLGTLGIGGIAFALAAQDTIKNIFGAFTIFTDKPFTIGDVIRFDSYEGTVVDVGMRSTKLRNYDKRLVTFPNSKLTDASIVNISAEPMRRVVMKLGLTYDTTPENMQKAMEILKSIPSEVQFVSSKDVDVSFSEFGDSALILTFIYFIEKRGAIRSVTSNVNLKILSAFNEAGLNFAFPTQTIYIEESSGNS
jgi:Small-conductance mechanosensitive channel